MPWFKKSTTVVTSDGGTTTQPVQGSSIDKFTQLTDVPDSYVGQAGKVVKVASGENGVEFVALPTPTPGVTTLTGLTDVPDAYTGQAGKVVTVKSDESGVDFVAPVTGVTTLTGLNDAPHDYTGQGGKLLSVKKDETGVEFVDKSEVVLWSGDTYTEGTVIGLTDSIKNYRYFRMVINATGIETHLIDDMSTSLFYIKTHNLADSGTAGTMTLMEMRLAAVSDTSIRLDGNYRVTWSGTSGANATRLSNDSSSIRILKIVGVK